jgi:hypothetical protein
MQKYYTVKIEEITENRPKSRVDLSSVFLLTSIALIIVSLYFQFNSINYIYEIEDLKEINLNISDQLRQLSFYLNNDTSSKDLVNMIELRWKAISKIVSDGKTNINVKNDTLFLFSKMSPFLAMLSAAFSSISYFIKQKKI